MALNADRTPSVIAKGPRCSVCMALAAMDDRDRGVLLGWMTDPRITDRMTQEWLKEDAGIDVAFTALGHHRRGSCQGLRA